ncbi:MAG: fluoride efflux transporter CrcB [Planctomycetes bacterium]|nr:fluoride efflux transporter CrcB [Planctomycetota bacterium]
MLKALLVGLGGFLGAIARYELSGLVHRYLSASFPYGTLVVNVLGCLAIGGVLHLVEDRSLLGPNTRLFLTIGILGGFTTFSSFGYETMELLRDGESALALANVAGNVVLGLGAVWLGRTVPRLVGM